MDWDLVRITNLKLRKYNKILLLDLGMLAHWLGSQRQSFSSTPPSKRCFLSPMPDNNLHQKIHVHLQLPPQWTVLLYHTTPFLNELTLSCREQEVKPSQAPSTIPNRSTDTPGASTELNLEVISNTGDPLGPGMQQLQSTTLNSSNCLLKRQLNWRIINLMIGWGTIG